MDDALEAVIAAQKLSDSVYDLFVHQIGSTMEQAEIASRDPNITKQFKMSAGGAVLKFQDKAVMRSDEGAPVKNFLKVNRLDFLLPPETPDPIKALDIPQDLIVAAKTNLTAKSNLFTLLHGGKPKSEEAATLAKVNALIAGGTLTEPVNTDPIIDDRTRRANRTTEMDHANNPWGAAWNVTKQGELTRLLIRTHGEAEGLKRAEAIAAAAGSKIGATRPAKVA